MNCGIIAHEAKKLPEYFGIVKRAFQNLPEGLKPVTKYDNKNEYEFVQRFDGLKLDSKIYVAYDIRGGTTQNLHITESAFIKDRAKLKAGSFQAVGKYGRISEETTGNGYNEFYDEFTDALKNNDPGEFDEKAYFYPWFIHPEYTLLGSIDQYTEYETWIKEYAKGTYNVDITDGQLLWRRWKMKQLKVSSKVAGLTGEQLFKQEYPASVSEAFQSGAGNVFSGELIEKELRPTPLTIEQGIALINERIMPDEDKELLITSFKRLVNKEVKIWRLPEPGRTFVVGVDPSDGTPSGDPGTIAVWDKDLPNIEDDVEKVAEYNGHLRPDLLGDLAVEIAEFYNHAFLGVENNMLTCILHIANNTGYDNYYMAVKFDKKTKQYTKELGWRTDGKTRDPMIDDFKGLYEDNNLKVNSSTTLDQMLTFVKKDNGKREHADGKHDDMLFADFIAIQLRKLQPRGGRAFTHNPLG